MSKTKSGFEYTVDPRILTDWRFTIAVAKLHGGDDMEKLANVSTVVNLLLGDEQTQKLMDHISKKNDGFVPAAVVMKEITEIMSDAKEAKN